MAVVQCFGERTPGEDIQEADIISAIEFDRDGMHLATGDRGGRVVLFERTPLAPVRAAGPNSGALQRSCCSAASRYRPWQGRLEGARQASRCAEGMRDTIWQCARADL